MFYLSFQKSRLRSALRGDKAFLGARRFRTSAAIRSLSIPAKFDRVISNLTVQVCANVLTRKSSIDLTPCPPCAVRKQSWYRFYWLLLFILASAIALTTLAEKVRAQSDLPSSIPKLEKKEKLPENRPNNIPESITVKKFQIVGSSVFSEEELAKITKPFTNRPISLSELFQVRSAITEFYTSKGYINSGAYIPPQELQGGVVVIQILEGELETINVTVQGRLNSEYIRSRIALTAQKPLNVNTLLESLQLLRLDPLIDNISAELSAGANPGMSLLDVKVKSADSFALQGTYDNGRSPSVGSERRIAQITEGNVFGWGDSFDFRYTNTDGSNALDFSYKIPINARNGTFTLAYGTTDNDVIEKPFDEIDIDSKSRYYELTLRQPIFQKPDREFILGLTGSRTESDTTLLDTPFPLSRGANERGETRISALRFFQEWTQRNEQQVFAARSQFSVGLDAFDATVNDNDQPDTQFFIWRGQGQWVRRLGEDYLFLIRGDLQVAGGSLVPLEQFSLGGFNSVRGYRQDLLLSDSGFFLSSEIRLPIFKISRIKGVLQLTPFIDFGTAWNRDSVELNPDTLVSVGVGLNWQQGDRLNARIDWGIPLVDVDTEKNTLQESGVYFSINYKLF
ncbi:MAG: ShlB/FhaC/HecB family hemolysin secretion/activation protein [Xenococcaceae cyanobacterium]